MSSQRHVLVEHEDVSYLNLHLKHLFGCRSILDCLWLHDSHVLLHALCVGVFIDSFGDDLL